MKAFLEKDWVRRALKTFVEAFLGIMIPSIVVMLQDINNANLSLLFPLLCSSLAAGIAAVWNIYLESRQE